ncbi:MAG: insulinase family protein [Pyrinomonadaceae bacterium MAG19_C2-C3]|nr:insulinase family protein [Pyrinomonadaceae bacterium MAG19_C2-C3]
MINQVRSTVLSNGATVLTEYMPGVRSATVGIWVRAGSRHESPDLNGMCHFIEHAVFKGTHKRTAMDIAIESDRLGGHFDAYTTHEMTAFTLKVVDTAVPLAFDLIADMILAPRFEPEELEREQRVIIEEMKMVEDSPEDYLGEVFNLACFPNHGLGRPIEGTADTVTTFDFDKTTGYHRAAYAPARLVIAAAGNISHESFVELVEQAFAARASHIAPVTDHAPTVITGDAAPRHAAPIVIERKAELEQAQMLLASTWVSAVDEDRYAASLLASIIGGGTSSRLWQSVRETRGLAYSVGASASTFCDTGIFYIYAGTSPDTLDEVLDLSLQEMRRTVHEAVEPEELQLVKDQAVASILLGLESSSARAGALARQEIIHNRHITPDEIIHRIEAVTPDDIRRIAQTHFVTDRLALGALGNLEDFKVDRDRLTI